MKLALLSDSHDNTNNLEKAVTGANSRGCEVLIHAGDLMDPQLIGDLKQFKGKVIFVFGNNDSEKEEMRQRSKNSNVIVAGDFFDGMFDNKRLYVTHYPSSAEKAFLSNSYDLVIFGHTHQHMSETRDGKTLVNPGEIYGQRKGYTSWAIYDTESSAVEFIEIV